MNAKNLVLDFINYAFITFLIGLAIIFIISPGYFEAFIKIMHAIIPFSVFGVLLLVKFKFGRTEIAKKQADQEADLVLTLTYMDKMKGELLVFALPILIIVTSFFSETGYNINDFFQAAFAFIIMYFWQKNLFSKRSQ